MKSRQSLSQYDYRPPEMLAYLRHYGYHFSRRMHDFAVSRMRRDNKPITPWTKEKVEQVIHKYGITLDNAIAYDHVYVLNMALADFYGSSITDERALALFVKDYVDDEDQPDGFIFNRFYAIFNIFLILDSTIVLACLFSFLKGFIKEFKINSN